MECGTEKEAGMKFGTGEGVGMEFNAGARGFTTTINTISTTEYRIGNGYGAGYTMGEGAAIRVPFGEDAGEGVEKVLENSLQPQ